LDKQDFAPSETGNIGPSVAGASESSRIGIAMCDSQLRYVSVNNALAAMNGVPAEAHTGKTVREVIGPVGSTVELMLLYVMYSGESVLNAEIRGQLPTRNTEGYWIANYFPVRDATGRVDRVGTLVIEITWLKRLEKCILALMGNMPRKKAQHTFLGMPYGLEKESSELWSGSIEMVETSVREMLKNPQKLRPTAQMSNIGGAVTEQRVRLPHAHSAFPNERFGQNLGARLLGNDVVKPLSPREIEIFELLARGKSNKEISTALRISVKTVESHRAKIRLKLNIDSASDLMLQAVRQGIVKP
jgi:DNA-binding CsgD family transcriptional regulator